MTRNTMLAAEKNEAIVRGTDREPGSFTYIPTAFAFAEFFGGGFECMPFWRQLWPFSSIRSLDQEED